ncbi:MAG: hypothetical protein FJ034_02990 [Chloroflexi bacterium]|nr:hypothetical protein [Chloroflexota bacterium]
MGAPVARVARPARGPLRGRGGHRPPSGRGGGGRRRRRAARARGGAAPGQCDGRVRRRADDVRGVGRAHRRSEDGIRAPAPRLPRGTHRA